jgi:hypothetical protein
MNKDLSTKNESNTFVTLEDADLEQVVGGWWWSSSNGEQPDHPGEGRVEWHRGQDGVRIFVPTGTSHRAT